MNRNNVDYAKSNPVAIIAYFKELKNLSLKIKLILASMQQPATA